MAEKTNVPEIRFAGFTDPWEQRKLGNCGTTYGGLSGKTKEDFGHGNARFVPYTNVFDNPLTDTKRLETVEIDSSQNKVAYGDTFFTVSSETPDEVGMSSVWLSDQDDVYLNSFCFGYRQDSTFDPHYLAYMLRSSSIRSDLTLLAQGISRFNISKNKVMELSVPVPSAAEQKQIGQYFARLDSLITLHQRKYDKLAQLKKSMLDKIFPKPGERFPEIRFAGFTDPWEQRKLGDELKRIQERNREGLGDDRWISVSRMYFQNPDKVQSNNLDTRTYVMRHGDMAFEGHKNSEHEYGRLVVNDIGDGIISELFPIYRHKWDFDNQFWKYAAMLETIWRPIFARSIAASGNSSNKLIDDHMFSESVFVPCVEEQRAIGTLLHQIDRTITLHQRKLELLRNTKKSLLDRMFV